MNNMISLDNFADGALAEKFNLALVEVLNNIRDMNTDFKPKRKVTLELTIVPSEDRELAEVIINTKTKLAPAKAVPAILIIDTDGRGNALASEFKKQIPGQSTMIADPETGEVLTTGEMHVEADYEPVNLEGLQIVK